MHKCKYCKEKAEWLDELCQEHWERYCAQSWWEMMSIVNTAGAENGLEI